jgi:hypothetical protein
VADASAASREAREAPSVPAAPGPLSASASRADARGPAAATRGAGAAAPAAAAAGRRTTAAAPETFRDVRLLVVSGRKADERAVSLRFGDDVIAAVAERDGSTVLAIPEAELSYAAYTRGKDPTWSVILAGPPPNTDFPGGLFRSARHWLTLQSRSTFLILRLNDNDWRRVLEAVTARTGVQVTIAKPSDRP